jgi:hypothetical protein
MKVKHVLSPMRFVVLPNRDAVGGTRFLGGPSDPGQGRHERTRQHAFDVVDLDDVFDRHDEHVTLVPGLLVKTGKHHRVLIAVSDRIGSQRP